MELGSQFPWLLIFFEKPFLKGCRKNTILFTLVLDYYKPHYP